MEDAEIIERVKQGDFEAFSLIVEKYHSKLLYFVFALIRDRDMAEDLGQEIFLSVYKSIGNFNEKKGIPFSAWLFICARNRCISEIRNRTRRRGVNIDDVPSIASERRPILDSMIDEERTRMLLASLDNLDEPYRGAIIRNLQGYSLSEIASREGVAVGTIKSRLYRAREMIREYISMKIGGKEYE